MAWQYQSAVVVDDALGPPPPGGVSSDTRVSITEHLQFQRLRRDADPFENQGGNDVDFRKRGHAGAEEVLRAAGEEEPRRRFALVREEAE